MKKIVSFSITLLSVFAISCTNRNWEDLHPNGQPLANNGACDSAGIISFSNQIKPMLTSSCQLNAGSGCHDVTSAFDYNVAANVQADATNGTLLARFRLGISKPTHMPKGGGFLPTCDTAKFRNWVMQGAPINN